MLVVQREPLVPLFEVPLQLREQPTLPRHSGLFIIGTPIGNREDITLRALRILSEVDFIICENTRKSQNLLGYYKIKKPLRSYCGYRKNEEDWAVDKLKLGINLALITDSGMPGIQDPAASLIRRVRELDICSLTPIPGPSALSTAVSMSGMQSNPCLFLGFLKSRRGIRQRTLALYKDFPGLVVIYENSRRLLELVTDLAQVYFTREILIAREMTKLHEEFHLFRLDQELAPLTQEKIMGMDRGEFTIVIGPIRSKGIKNNMFEE